MLFEFDFRTIDYHGVSGEKYGSVSRCALNINVKLTLCRSSTSSHIEDNSNFLC